MLFKKSQHGWRLLRQSMALLAEQKKIWILSLIGRGFFLLLITALSVLVAFIRSGVIDYRTLSEREILWGYVVMLAVLWLGNIAISYFNAALTATLVKIENSEPVSLSAALKVADWRFGTIFSWIIAHFTFGGVVAVFRSKLSESKRINYLLSGLSWPFASYLFPPLIITEPAGFFSTLRRSSELISQPFGQNPRLNYSNAFLSLSLRIVAMVPLTIGLHLQRPIWIILGAVISFLMILVISVVFNAASVAILYAFYEFLAHDKTIRHFKTQDIATLLFRSRLRV